MADKVLNPKQQKFVAEYMRDRNAAQAARAAGYSESYSVRASSTLLFQPAIRAEVDRQQAALSVATGLSLQEFDRILCERGAIAVQKSQMNAAAKYDEMRGKMHGHLVERIQVDARPHIDLRAILAEAQGRVRLPPIIDTTATPVPDEEAAQKLLED